MLARKLNFYKAKSYPSAIIGELSGKCTFSGTGAQRQISESIYWRGFRITTLSSTALLYFFPLPQGQGWFLPTFKDFAGIGGFSATGLPVAEPEVVSNKTFKRPLPVITE